jgi:hypothetical protein
MRIISITDMLQDRFDGYFQVRSLEEFENTISPFRNFDLKWPEQSGNYFSRASIVWNLLKGEKIQLSFHERGIWSASENLHLFKCLMVCTSGSQTLALDEALEFDADDESGISFLQLGLQFGWGGLLFLNKENWFYFSHDSWGRLALTKDVGPWLSQEFDLEKIRDP